MHNPMFDEKGRVWFTSRRRSPQLRPSASKGPTIRRRGCSRRGLHPTARDVRSGRRQIHADQYLLPTHHSGVRGRCEEHLWTSAGAAERRHRLAERKMFDETRRRAEVARLDGLISSIATATASATNMWSRNQPVDPAKDKRVNAGFYGVGVARSTARSGDLVLGFPGNVVRARSGRQPTGDRVGGNLRASVPGYAPRGMDIDRDGVVWVAVERPSGELRPAQVQGAAEWTDRDRQALSGRLDALSDSRDRRFRT